MIVRARTEYTKQFLLKFSRFNVCRQPRQVVIYVITELVMLILASIYIFTSDNMVQFTISVAVIAPIHLLVVPAVVFGLPKLYIRKNKKAFGVVHTYEFSDSGILIESTLPMVAGQIKVNYGYIESVNETEDALYLYNSRNEAFIMNKSDIVEGSLYELQELLRKNIPSDKFFVKRKSFNVIPILLPVIIVVIAFVTVFSFLNLISKNYGEKTFSKSGLTITLTAEFYEDEMEPFTAFFDSENIGVFAIKEEFAQFQNNKSLSLKEYAEIVIDNFQVDAEVKEADGLTSFTFNEYVDGEEYTYFATIYRSNDALWLLQFVCESTKYEELKPTIIQYAKSVDV